MAPEAAGVQLNGHAARQRQLPDVERGALGADAARATRRPRPARPAHGRVVERATVPVQHHPLAARGADPHLRQARARGVVAVQLERQHLPEPRRTAASIAT